MSSVVDFDIDERCTLTVIVNTKKPDGTARDITGATIEWEATHNGIVKSTKTIGAGITLGTPASGLITYFTISILPTDTILDDNAEYGTPVVWFHEARIVLTTSEFIAIRGRMFVIPSQTGD